MACIHCTAEPVLRRDEATGLSVMVCPGCKARSEVSAVESRVLATWRIVNDADLPVHPCIKGERPRFYQRDGIWGFYCKGCSHVEEGLATLEGAVAAWMRETRFYANA